MLKHIQGPTTTERRFCAQPRRGAAEIASDGVANARMCTHVLALCSLSVAISVSNQVDAMNLNRPWDQQGNLRQEDRLPVTLGSMTGF